MSNSCPNKKSTAWDRLISLTKGDESRAMNTFIRWGYNTPEDQISAEKAVNGIGFKAKNVSHIGLGRMLGNVKRYNAANGTSHYVEAKQTGDNDLVYDLTLTISMTPKKSGVYTPRASTETMDSSSVRDIDGDTAVVETVDSPYNDRIADVDGITVVNGNEYWFGEELHPSMEDAMAARDALEFQMRGSGYGMAIDGLDEYLIELLGKYGISVKQINDFREKFGVDGIAVADMLNKMIWVAQGKADATTLPEEASHFIIEMLGENNPLYKAMERVIKSTQEYKDVVAEYSEIYGNNEKKLMKEAMGKVLAKKLVDKYNGENQSLFDRVIQWFKNLFKSSGTVRLEKAIDDAFSEVADGILNGYIGLDGTYLVGKDMYFQLSPEEKLKKTLGDNINRLKDRISMLSRRISSSGGDERLLQQIERYKDAIDVIKDKISMNQLKEAVSSFVTAMETIGLEDISVYMQEAYDNRSILSSNKIEEIYHTHELYLKAIDELFEVLDNRSIPELDDIFLFENKDGLTVAERITEIRGRLGTIKHFQERQYRARVKEILKDISITYTGPDGKEVKFNPDELLDSKIGAMGWVGANLMPMHAVNDEVLKMVYKIVADIYHESHRGALNDGYTLMNLQKAMNDAGFKDMSIFHEKDTNGNKTGYLISNFNWGEYNSAYDKMHRDVVSKINSMRKDPETHYSDYYEIRVNDLSKDEQIAYRAIQGVFNAKYTKKKDGVYHPNPPTNPEFQKMMNSNPAVRAYYEELKRIHLKTKQMLPRAYNSQEKVMLLPQIRKDDMQLLNTKDTFSNKLKKIGVRALDKVIRLDDELGYGDTSSKEDGRKQIKTVSGVNEKLLPIYFTLPLKDKSELTDDTTSMYAHFSEMARNFNGLNKRLGDLRMIQMAVAERNVVTKRRGEDKIVKGGREYEALEKFMDVQVFGHTKQDLQVKIGDKNINATKILESIINFVRRNNLFMNTFTILAGTAKANIDTFIDANSGLYITKESQAWAMIEFARGMGSMTVDNFKRFKSSKMGIMLSYSEASDGLKEIFRRLDLNNPIQRATADEFWYGAYEPFSAQVKGVYALSVYDNYRLVDGKFINKAEYEDLNKGKDKKAINEEWAKLRDKSLYNAYEVSNGKRVVKPEFKEYVTSAVENKIEGLISSRIRIIEGNLGAMDKTGWSANIVWQMMMMHRGWMVQLGTERLKKGGVNYQTGMYEEGFYRTVGKAIKNLIEVNEGKLAFNAAYFKELQPYQKRNLIRAGTDIAFTAALTALFLIVNAWADDEDDENWGAQYAAFLTTRMLLEQGAFSNPGEFSNILNSVTPLATALKSLSAILNVFTAGEEIEYGVYEGLTRAERAMIKLSPLKNLWELQDPAAKNKYIRNQIFSN